MELIWKVDNPGTMEEKSNVPGDVKILRRRDLPTVIWEVLEHYAKVFPSESPKGVPPAWVDYEFKIDLEDESPPIHRLL